MFSNYLNDKDWQIKENANTQKSINGMNNYVRETFTKQYWLHEVYPEEVRHAHTIGIIGMNEACLNLFHDGSDITSEKGQAFVRSIFNHYKLPYISLTPSFSVCNSHGYIKGEQFNCPECGEETEVWSRVVGYLRPVNNFNKGKKEEYFERKKYAVVGCGQK